MSRPIGVAAGVDRPLGRLFSRVTSSRALMFGAGFLLLMIALSLLGPLVLPNGPLDQAAAQLQSPTLAHPFGTDELGRDILVRCLVGARSTLLVAVVAAVCAGTVGTVIGVVSGFFGGWVDALAMRVIDVLLALPSILIALVIVALLGPDISNVVMAIAIVEVPAFARLARASTLSLKERPFVEAARAAGYGKFAIMRRSILPNALSPVAVQLVVASASAILVVAALSYLGLGEQPPAPSLGGMLKSSQLYLGHAPWYPIFPGVLVTALVAAFGGIGSGLARMVSGIRTGPVTAVGQS